MAHEYGKETLSKEFKSDLKGLPDSELVEAVVALANTDGGCVYLGVEDDGTPTGVKQKHQDPIGMAAMIANRTVPPISVRSELVGDDIKVVQVEVPKSQSVVSTKSGKILRRMMKMDGTPESVPMYPYEIATRLSDLGRLDYSAQPVMESTRDDLDPLERDRLRKIIASYRRGVSVLLPRSVPDKAFVELLAEERERSGKSMSLDGLLILDKLKSERRCGFDVLSGSLDMSDQRLRTVLGQLTEAGLVESAGVGARRTYMLGAKVYRRSGRAMEYVRQSDIDRVRYPELIIELMHEQKSVSKNDVMELLHLEENQAYYQLRKLVLEGRAKKVGSGRNVRYAAVR